MASMWLNGFNPQTKAGGLQGFVNALFDGETPNQAEGRALKAAQMRAQTRQFDASAGKLGAERALLDDTFNAYQDPESWISAITQIPREGVRAELERLNGGLDNRIDIPGWAKPGPVTPGTTAMIVPEVGPMGVAGPAYDPSRYDAEGRPNALPAPSIPMPGPAVLAAPPMLSERGAADSRRVAEALATFISTRMAKPNNPNDIAKAFATGIDRTMTEDILAGIVPADVGAERVAAAGGKPLVNMNAAGQVVNQFSGAPGPSNDLVASSIAENRAQERKYGNDAAGDEFIDMMVGGRRVQVSKKDASRYGAEAAFRDPRRTGGGAKEDPLVWVDLPDGRRVQVRQSDLSRETVKQLYPDPAKAPRPMNAGERRGAQETIVGGLDAIEKNADGAFPPELRAQILGRAMELADSPDYFANGAQALTQAIAEIMPDGFGVDGEWNPFKSNVIAPRGGARTPAPRTPAAPATDMSGKPGATPKVARPSGATDAQLLQEANDAIKKGADRNKVLQRLRDMGVQVE
jgi:hypothetical protein